MQAESLQPGVELFESVIESLQPVVVLQTKQSTLLIEQFRALARRTGQSVYLWKADAGLCSLREGELRVPGCQRISDTLRYALHSLHFGVYLLEGFTVPLSATNVALLKQIAHTPTEHVRRVVLFSEDPTLVDALDGARLINAQRRMRSRPRLRDGRWLV
ncbi:hypothetical protein [Oleiagrimonas sp. C23AA]|uniref:hypothetical protein n=1 Tax=Oleiagrimonas sp. C23AA TaxID=2719047 RepID=UPI00141E29F8|nr:hypothetical protein [Oleiagrimonas sp. C23AA]NII10386.1 hypothetical protein [Oleiagrimonas sp. C23AA]